MAGLNLTFLLQTYGREWESVKAIVTHHLRSRAGGGELVSAYIVKMLFWNRGTR